MLKGWDYEELADEWNLFLPEHLDDFNGISVAEWISIYLQNFMYGDKRKRVRRKAIKDIRIHCKLMSEYDCFDESAIWKAFSEIKHEYTLLNFFIPLIKFAWT